MYNNDVFCIIKDNEGCTVVDIIRLQGVEYNTTNRNRVLRQLRSLVKFDILRVEKIQNPSPHGRRVINSYYLSQSTKKEIEDGRI
jgi:hypothetical protein